MNGNWYFVTQFSNASLFLRYPTAYGLYDKLKRGKFNKNTNLNFYLSPTSPSSFLVLNSAVVLLSIAVCHMATSVLLFKLSNHKHKFLIYLCFDVFVFHICNLYFVRCTRNLTKRSVIIQFSFCQVGDFPSGLSLMHYARKLIFRLSNSCALAYAGRVADRKGHAEFWTGVILTYDNNFVPVYCSIFACDIKIIR